MAWELTISGLALAKAQAEEWLDELAGALADQAVDMEPLQDRDAWMVRGMGHAPAVLVKASEL